MLDKFLFAVLLLLVIGSSLAGCPATQSGNLKVGANPFNTCGFSNNTLRSSLCGEPVTAKIGVFSFVAPVDAVYALTTYPGTPYDQTLDILDPSNCSILACATATTNVAKISLRANQRIHVRVGSDNILRFGSNNICDTNFVLSITQYTPGCMPSPPIAAAYLQTGANVILDACGPPYEPSYVMCSIKVHLKKPMARYFVAPDNGTYTFAFASISSQGALSVRSEVNGHCQVLNCNRYNTATVNLTKNQRVIVVVGFVGFLTGWEDCYDLVVLVTKGQLSQSCQQSYTATTSTNIDLLSAAVGTSAQVTTTIPFPSFDSSRGALISALVRTKTKYLVTGYLQWGTALNAPQDASASFSTSASSFNNFVLLNGSASHSWASYRNDLSEWIVLYGGMGSTKWIPQQFLRNLPNTNVVSLKESGSFSWLWCHGVQTYPNCDVRGSRQLLVWDESNVQLEIGVYYTYNTPSCPRTRTPKPVVQTPTRNPRTPTRKLGKPTPRSPTRKPAIPTLRPTFRG